MFNDMINEKKKPGENESRPTIPIPREFLIVCLVGLIVFAGGLTLATGSHLLKSRNSAYGYSEYRSTDDSIMVRTVGVILAEIGTILTISGFLSAGFIAKGLDRQTRVGLLGSSFGLLFVLLIFTLIFGLT